MAEFTVTKLERHQEWQWTCRITPAGGEAVECDRRGGVWRVTKEGDDGSFQHLLYEVAAVLQAKVHRIEHPRSGRRTNEMEEAA